MTEQPIIRELHPVDPRTMSDYSADCSDRLLAFSLPPMLHEAARCAGRQPEWLKALVMGWRSDGRLVGELAARRHCVRAVVHQLPADIARIILRSDAVCTIDSIFFVRNAQ
jgi:hypothetical protein